MAIGFSGCGGGGGGGGGGDDKPASEDGGEETARDGGAEDKVTWYGRAQPIIEARCVTCHYSGGPAPFALETLDEVKAVASLVAVHVEAGHMPPLPADDHDCRPLSDSRIMPDQERADLVAWVGAGMPLGDPGEAPKEPLPSFVVEPPLGEPTASAAFAERYTNDGTVTDDYRCMIVDPAWDHPRYLSAIAVQPGNPALVHHVLVFAQLPEDAAEVDALDAADPGPGYECFGNAGFSGARPIGSFVPGATPRGFPGGATVALPAGARFVMQMHYNFISGGGEDESTLKFWEVTTPSEVKARGLVMIDSTFKIPAGDSDFSVTATSPIVAEGSLEDDGTMGGGGVVERMKGEPGLAWGVSAHMHTRGSSARVDVVHADGSEECLLDIPDWHFHWQGEYRFREPLELVEGDVVRLTCRWDNSAENQPVVDGVQLEPKELVWGSGSLDEMCLGTVKMTTSP